MTARAPNHVWHVDLTVVPTRAGFWIMLRPFASLQRRPFAYWVAVIVDHFSRRAVGFAVFRVRRSVQDVIEVLGRAVQLTGTKRRYIVTDKGRQF